MNRAQIQAIIEDAFSAFQQPRREGELDADVDAIQKAETIAIHYTNTESHS
jgi:hypothetical protein